MTRSILSNLASAVDAATPSRVFIRLHSRLPIFGLVSDRITGGGIVYTPGNVIPLNQDHWVHFCDLLKKLDATGDSHFTVAQFQSNHIGLLTRRVLDLASQAKQRYDELVNGEFSPECLTLYLSNHCNLGCDYCYAAEPDGSRIGAGAADQHSSHPLLPVLPSRPRQPILSEAAVRAAAQIVARNCRDKQKPFQLVLHGGGEPTLHPALLKSVVAITKATARDSDLTWSGYLASHGIIDPDLVSWLAETFTQIGISCDGPQDIHDAQRPQQTGGVRRGTFHDVSRTIRQLRSAGAALTLRATITPQSVRRQAEIVEFFCHEFGVRDIRFEPAYDPHGRKGNLFQPDDAPSFANHFLAAQRIAEVFGCHLELSGVRLDEIHGPFCNVLRNVLQLTPDGSASACFLCTDGRSQRDESFVIGKPHDTGEFQIDQTLTQTIQTRATALPGRCHDCVNLYHCARDCPEVCPVIESQYDRLESPGFRCRVQKQLSETWIRELGQPQGAFTNQELQHSEQDRDDLTCLIRLLAELPKHVDPDAIVRQWLKASRVVSTQSRVMPPPTWVRRPWDDQGETVWENLRSTVARTCDTSPMAVYVHIPFCDRKCAFCDCYAIYQPPNSRQGEEPLVAALRHEIQAWAALPHLRDRPLSTIHFGGGTANYLSSRHFIRIVDELRETFNSTSATEWAVETTSSQITPEHTEELWNWGFRRIHVGVQTLDDSLRQVIGRREHATTVLAKLDLLLRRGFIVSVDLVYGLPNLTLARFAKDIEALVNTGIDGCSLYHLNASERNAHFITEHKLGQRSVVTDYVFFHLGEHLLRDHGFEKNHFAHFARPRDRNVYYTHVARGEDLLALGPSADGNFADYSYRHPHLAAYTAACATTAPAFEGGMRETDHELRIRPASAALMSGSIEASLLQSLSAGPLLDYWLELEWLESHPGMIKKHRLTPSGSWHLNALLEGLIAYLKP